MSKSEILQTGSGNKEISKLDTNMDDSFEMTKKRALNINLIYLSSGFLLAITRFIVFFILGYSIIEGTASFSILILFAGALSLMDGIFDLSTTLFKDMTKDFPIIEKLWDTFDNIPEIKNYDIGDSYTYIKGDIELKNISFAYNEGKNVFSDFNLTLKGNKKTAFVGASGSGKTTIIKMIASYISPDKGNIFVDGQNLNKIKLIEYYKHIGYLTQEPSIFDGSIYENLLYALNHKPSDKELQKVIKDSKCEFILDFDDGLETQIGERGIRLSGGQKQRLAIAKIMLKKPNIILLDEPTSALDSISEQKVSEALHNLFKGKTIIIVAHRLQTVKEADEIIVIENGEIVQKGTHISLSNKKGKYKDMLDLQTSF